MSELLILQEVMQRIQMKENLESVPLPCEYFDMIGGTSTGGFAIILSPKSAAC
jgi:patatin-like phospholipase/acyl hydrolase